MHFSVKGRSYYGQNGKYHHNHVNFKRYAAWGICCGCRRHRGRLRVRCECIFHCGGDRGTCGKETKHPVHYSPPHPQGFVFLRIKHHPLRLIRYSFGDVAYIPLKRFLLPGMDTPNAPEASPDPVRREGTRFQSPCRLPVTHPIWKDCECKGPTCLRKCRGRS